jgi:hypothetical protein
MARPIHLHTLVGVGRALLHPSPSGAVLSPAPSSFVNPARPWRRAGAPGDVNVSDRACACRPNGMGEISQVGRQALSPSRPCP